MAARKVHAPDKVAQLLSPGLLSEPSANVSTEKLAALTRGGAATQPANATQAASANRNNAFFLFMRLSLDATSIDRTTPHVTSP
jgi:hypothetical protein